MSDHRGQFEKIREQVEAWREELGVPGVTFGVTVSGESYTAGAGVTSVENPLPVTDRTLFQIGSITKTVTATAMLRLVEEGRLDLRAKVRDYLPGFRVRDPDASARVTVWHLLTHLAGWAGDVFTDTGNNDDAGEKYVTGMTEFEQLAPLGTVFSYNNAAFCVAGRVIEVLTGATYEQAIHDLIFAPLGMEHSFFFPHQAMLHRFAVGHQAGGPASDRRVLSPWAIPRGMNAAGGISCHIRDLLRYGAYHLGAGPPLLQTESLQHMHSPQATINSTMGFVGLAWIMNEYSGQNVHWHNGGTNGQNAVLTLAPAHGLALGMMTNGNVGDKLNERFNKAVLREFCGIEIPAPTVIESTKEQLSEYAGLYSRPLMDIELRMEEGQLLADTRIKTRFPTDAPWPETQPAAVARCGTDQLLVLEGDYKDSRADIIRDEKGTIRYLRFGSRINVRQ